MADEKRCEARYQKENLQCIGVDGHDGMHVARPPDGEPFYFVPYERIDGAPLAAEFMGGRQPKSDSRPNPKQNSPP